MIGWFDSVIVFTIVTWFELNDRSGSNLKIWWKVAYIFDVLSQVDLVWNIMKRGNQEVLMVGAFVEGVKASFK